MAQAIDEREPGGSESSYPGKPPYLVQVRMFWSAHKDSFLSFAAWMGGAELILMLCVAEITYGMNPYITFRETVEHLYWAGVAGAVLGVIPAILVAVIVAARGKRPSLWIVGATSILVTLGLAYLHVVSKMN